jgi:hypothetical protein
MKVETDELIERLAASAKPVHRLKAPWTRAALWLAIALPYVALVVWSKLAMIDVGAALADARFLIEQTATLVTALGAAVAAFYSVVPGHDRRVLLLPLIPLGVWLASVGNGCLQDWFRLGPDGLAIRPDWECLPAASVIGIVPAIAMLIMLRRGAPLYPRATLALGALAVAAIGNFGMQAFHFRDASIMVLVWHLGSVMLLSALAGWLGKHVLGWRRTSVIA